MPKPGHVDTLDIANRRALLLGLGAIGVGAVYGGYGKSAVTRDQSIIAKLQSLKNSNIKVDHQQFLRELLDLISKRGADHGFMEDLAELVADMDLESFVYNQDVSIRSDLKLSNPIMQAFIKGQDYNALLHLIQSIGANEHCQGSDKAQAMFALKSIINPNKIGLARISDGTEPTRRALSESFNPRSLHQRPE